MSDSIFPKQDFATPQDALAHYGVKGMRWGVRKTDLPGVSRKTNKEARKDAEEFARAKMFYGDGAGTRRKLIKAQVNAKSKRNPDYKQAFEHHLDQQDLGRHADKARSERRLKDVSSGTAKTARGVHRSLTGGFGSVTLTSAVIAGALVVGHQQGIDKAVANAAKTKYTEAKQGYQNKQTVNNLLKDLGLD